MSDFISTFVTFLALLAESPVVAIVLLVVAAVFAVFAFWLISSKDRSKNLERIVRAFRPR